MMRPKLFRFSKPAPVASSLAGSVVVHIVLIVSWVAVTQPRERAERPVPDNAIARFLAPPNRLGAQMPQREMIRYVAITVPEALGSSPAIADAAPRVETRLAAVDPVDVPALSEYTGVDSVYSVIEVDSAASRYEWSAAPVFPPAMLAERRSGFVRAEWVVDERGVADAGTFRVVEATHPDFEKAVRDALPFMRFRPARIRNVPVSQLVQQPFHFLITTVSVDSVGRRPLR